MAKLNQCVRIFNDAEARRPRQLAWINAYVDWYFDHQAECFAYNSKQAKLMFEQRVEIARPRLEAQRQWWREKFNGKPEEIEETAIVLFF